MAQTELLKHAVEVLDRIGVQSMLTGSLASSLQGEPRATHSRTAIEEAVRVGGMFKVLNLHEGDKIDFRMLTDKPFDQSRFARRQRYNVDGVPVDVSSPEDTILMKLKWSQAAGGSQLQVRDAQHIYELHRGVLDVQYIETWIQNLGLGDAWNRIQSSAEE